MGIVEKAIAWALNIANDNSHGYDQVSRWGKDYDCSSLVISAFEYAGLKVKEAGATYTGNMYSAFKKVGFVEVPISSRSRGDVLLNKKKHTAIYIGNNQMVQASINENGKTTGGKTGDQTGKEISVRTYYDYPWDVCLRYVEKESAAQDKTIESEVKKTVNIEMPTLEKGAKGEAVRTLQILLNKKFGENLETDGSFGQKTYNSVCRYQRAKNLLPVDGFVGQGTWNSLLK